MAGKYLLFFVLCFIVACFANDAPSNPTNEPDSTAEPEDGITASPATVKTTPTTVKTTPTTVKTTPTTVKTTPTTVKTTPTTVRTTPATVMTTLATVRTSPATVATPPGTVATPPGTVATPPGTVATPPGTVATPHGTVATPPATPASSGPVKPTIPPATTTAPSACHVNPCSQGSTCVARANQTFVCLCLPGENYDYIGRTCDNARVFPGQLLLPRDAYHPDLQDSGSLMFKAVAQTVELSLSRIFQGDGFSNATVISFRNATQRRVEQEPGVIASVEIFFNTASNITTDEVVKKVQKDFGSEAFNVTDLCDNDPCDEKTTECSAENGSFKCNCKKDFIKTSFSQRICVACPSGEYAKGSTECLKCSFGYSGLNCSESWKLILVIVGSVLGGLLLITVILLPILTRRSSKKSSKKSKNADMGKPYVSPLPAKLPQAEDNSSFTNSPPPAFPVPGFEGAGIPRIPRATASSSWDSRTNLEMIPSNSRQNLVPMDRNSRLYDDDYDTNSYTRPQSSQYAPARPRSNPYAQGRPQNNPYAPNQGQTNPYFMQNSGRW